MFRVQRFEPHSYIVIEGLGARKYIYYYQLVCVFVRSSFAASLFLALGTSYELKHFNTQG